MVAVDIAEAYHHVEGSPGADMDMHSRSEGSSTLPTPPMCETPSPIKEWHGATVWKVGATWTAGREATLEAAVHRAPPPMAVCAALAVRRRAEQTIHTPRDYVGEEVAGIESEDSAWLQDSGAEMHIVDSLRTASTAGNTWLSAAGIDSGLLDSGAYGAVDRYAANEQESGMFNIEEEPQSNPFRRDGQALVQDYATQYEAELASGQLQQKVGDQARRCVQIPDVLGGGTFDAVNQEEQDHVVSTLLQWQEMNSESDASEGSMEGMFEDQSPVQVGEPKVGELQEAVQQLSINATTQSRGDQWSSMPDAEVVRQFAPALLQEYVHVFPTVLGMEPEQWVNHYCLTTGELAWLCRCVARISQEREAEALRRGSRKDSMAGLTEVQDQGRMRGLLRELLEAAKELARQQTELLARVVQE